MKIIPYKQDKDTLELKTLCPVGKDAKVGSTNCIACVECHGYSNENKRVTCNAVDETQTPLPEPTEIGEKTIVGFTNNGDTAVYGVKVVELNNVKVAIIDLVISCSYSDAHSIYNDFDMLHEFSDYCQMGKSISVKVESLDLINEAVKEIVKQ